MFPESRLLSHSRRPRDGELRHVLLARIQEHEDIVETRLFSSFCATVLLIQVLVYSELEYQLLICAIPFCSDSTSTFYSDMSTRSALRMLENTELTNTEQA